MTAKIAIIDSADIAVSYTAEAVKSLGFEPVFLCQLPQYQGDTRRELAMYRHISCDTRSTTAVVAAILAHDVMPLAGILTTSDSRLIVACEAAIELRVPGIDPAVLKLKDKCTVAALVPEFSPPSLRFTPAGIPGDAMRPLFADGGKAIVKPTHGTGGLGIVMLDSADQWNDLPRLVSEAGLPAGIDTGSWIAQRFVDGPLFSAEGYVADHAVNLIGFSDRRKVGLTETAVNFPADAALPPAALARARAAIDALVQRSGFRDGYFHIEFIATDEGCYLVDANMGRVGGGPVGQLLALSCNTTPIEVYRHLIQVTLLGPSFRATQPLPHPFGAAQDRRETYAVLYGLEDGGIVSEVSLPDGMPCYHTQLLDPGAYVHPTGKDDWTWIGILAGFKRDTLRVIEQIRIRTPDGEFPAHF